MRYNVAHNILNADNYKAMGDDVAGSPRVSTASGRSDDSTHASGTDHNFGQNNSEMTGANTSNEVT